MARVFNWLASCVLSVALSHRAAAEIQVISRPYAPVPHAFGDSSDILLSADGRWAAFNSTANGLATNDHNGLNIDAFLRDLVSGQTTLLSRTPSGGSASGDSLVSDISADGQFVVFESDAHDLGNENLDSVNGLYLYNRTAGTSTRIAPGALGDSGAARITRNGRFVLFESAAENLANNDTNAVPDLFLFNRESGQISTVTLNKRGSGTAALVSAPVLGEFAATVSEDGRYVAFVASALDLVGAPPNGLDPQVYLRDMTAGTNLWVSRNSSGGLAQNVSRPLLSRDGTRLAFLATRLLGSPKVLWPHIYSISAKTLSEVPVPAGAASGSHEVTEYAFSGDGSALAFTFNGQIYWYDVASEAAPRLVSADRSGSPGSDFSDTPVLSEDGRTLIFTSAATNFTGLPATIYEQLFGYDVRSGALALLTPSFTGSGGAQRDILFPVLSGDGSRAGFMSYATDLVPNDDKFANDVFVVNSSGAEAPQLASVPDSSAVSATAAGPSNLSGKISRDGTLVVFSSVAADLVPDDTNNAVDVFVRDLPNGVTRRVSLDPNGAQFPGASRFLSMSADGRRIAFSGANLTTPGVAQSIYVYDASTGQSSIQSILPTGEGAATSQGNLSADGRYLGFWVGLQSLYVRDLQTGETILASSVRPTSFYGMSPGGKYLVFFSSTTSGIGLVDWQNSRTLSISALSSNIEMADDDSAILYYPRSGGPRGELWIYSLSQNSSNLIATNALYGALSGDGSTVVYQQGRGDGLQHLFVTYIASGDTREITFPHGAPEFRLHGEPTLSFDGRYIVFAAEGSLVGGEANAFNNIYLYDQALGTLKLISESLAGGYSEYGSGNPSLAATGAIVFESGASDLVPEDLNLASDVFVYTPGEPRLLIAEPAQSGGSYTLAWPLREGRQYQVQFRATLGAGNWQNVGSPVTANSSPFTFTPAEQSGFYRVQVSSTPQ